MTRSGLAALCAAVVLAAACSSGDPSPPAGVDDVVQHEPSEAPGSSGPAAAAQPAVLRTVPCPLGIRVEQNTCGIAEVPANPSSPASETVEISYVVVEGSRPGAAGHPVAVLQGGPGGASSDLAGWIAHREFTQVFVDQRGTGFAPAGLDCPESDDAFGEAMTLTSADAELLLLDRLAACAERLAGDPLFEHATTANQAADVIAVMGALGYRDWLVYGVSYGTTIALEILRQSPEGLRGAVLDGVYPADIDTEESIALSAPAALAAAGDACSADPSCPVANFDLPGTVERLIARFDESPARLDFDAHETSLGEPITAVLDGTRLAEFVFVALYDEDWAKQTVESLTRIEQGDHEALRSFLATTISLTHLQIGAIADAAYYAVECHERLPLLDGPDDAVLDPFVAAVLSTPLEQACEPWDRPEATNIAPVRSDLPVLMLTSEFDPITPERLAFHAAETLTDITVLTVEGQSHGVWFSSHCAEDMVSDFVADPHTAPSCAD